MGFVPGITTQIEAFLTEKGAEQLMTSGIEDIKYFAVADDAANYSTSSLLGINEMFTLAGKYHINNKQMSVLPISTTLDTRIFTDDGTDQYKNFETDSGSILVEQEISFKKSVTEIGIYEYVVDSLDNTSQYINWIKDLKLPYGTADGYLWSATYSNGGYSNTAIADMNTSDFLFFVLDSSQYSYMDGKSVKFTIPYFSGSVDCYSSYLETGVSSSYYDSQYSDQSSFLSRFGDNTVLLFADDIQPPNADATKTWSKGYNYDNAPYSQGGKLLSNFNATAGRNKDIAVGIAFLDKGVVVIFNSVLYNGYINRSVTPLTITNNNIVRRTVANFICDLPIGKFYRSQNTTFTTGTPIRISSVGLYNSNKELIAIGRFNTQIEKNMGKRLTILVKVVI